MGENNQDRPKGSKSKSRNRRPRRGPKHGPKGASAKGPNKNRRPKSLTPARILQKYDNLLEQHIVARRKYYEMHGRVQGKQLDKVEKNFFKTMEAIRTFEDGLKDWQRDVLKEKIDAYPEDRQYSSTHELGTKGDDVPFSGEFEDPHLLQSQIEADYSNDTEESVGTIDDYKNYKGLE